MTLRFTRDNRMSGPVAVAKDGSYSVSLAPGLYAVGFEGGPASEVNVAPGEVRVVAGQTRRVDFQIDTGLR